MNILEALLFSKSLLCVREGLSAFGGAVFVTDGGFAVFISSVLSENAVSGGVWAGGGAVFAWKRSQIKLEGARLLRNVAERGSKVAIGGGILLIAAALEVVDCICEHPEGVVENLILASTASWFGWDVNNCDIHEDSTEVQLSPEDVVPGGCFREQPMGGRDKTGKGWCKMEGHAAFAPWILIVGSWVTRGEISPNICVYFH